MKFSHLLVMQTFCGTLPHGHGKGAKIPRLKFGGTALDGGCELFNSKCHVDYVLPRHVVSSDHVENIHTVPPSSHCFVDSTDDVRDGTGLPLTLLGATILLVAPELLAAPKLVVVPGLLVTPEFAEATAPEVTMALAVLIGLTLFAAGRAPTAVAEPRHSG